VAAATRRAVVLQLERLMDYPMVRRGMEQGSLTLHGWYYAIEDGEIHVFDAQQGDFVPASVASNSGTDQANLEALGREIARARELSGGRGLIAVNVMRAVNAAIRLADPKRARADAMAGGGHGPRGRDTGERSEHRQTVLPKRLISAGCAIQNMLLMATAMDAQARGRLTAHALQRQSG
jgi:hypothetical protein